MNNIASLLGCIALCGQAISCRSQPPMPNFDCLLIAPIAINTKYQRPDRNPPPLYRYALIRHCLRPNEAQSAMRTITLRQSGQDQHFQICAIERVFEDYEHARACALMNNLRITSEQPARQTEFVRVPNLRENGKLPADFRVDPVIRALEAGLPPEWALVKTQQGFQLQARYQILDAKTKRFSTPFIGFALHQPWSEAELEGIVPELHPSWAFYANSAYFGLRVSNSVGLDSTATDSNTRAVYDQARALLAPKRISGTAQRAKLGDILIGENGAVYYLDDDRWAGWAEADLGRKAQILGLVLPMPTDDEPSPEPSARVQGPAWQVFCPRPQPLEQPATRIGVCTQNADKRFYLTTDGGKRYELLDIAQPEDFAPLVGKRVCLYGLLSETDSPFLARPQLPTERVELIAVFRKDVPTAQAEQILRYTDYPFWEGMDSSKGKAYFYQTGGKYRLVFPNTAERDACAEHLRAKSELYEAYIPDWTIQKD